MGAPSVLGVGRGRLTLYPDHHCPELFLDAAQRCRDLFFGTAQTGPADPSVTVTQTADKQFSLV